MVKWWQVTSKVSKHTVHCFVNKITPEVLHASWCNVTRRFSTSSHLCIDLCPTFWSFVLCQGQVALWRINLKEFDWDIIYIKILDEWLWPLTYQIRSLSNGSYWQHLMSMIACECQYSVWGMINCVSLNTNSIFCRLLPAWVVCAVGQT